MTSQKRRVKSDAVYSQKNTARLARNLAHVFELEAFFGYREVGAQVRSSYAEGEVLA